MDVIESSALSFNNLLNVKYHFVFAQSRKKKEIILDFQATDFRHAVGLQYVDDIVIERDPFKLFFDLVNNSSDKITDEILEKSRKYQNTFKEFGSVKERVSDLRVLEECLDTDNFMRIYKAQMFGSLIKADYFIESYCKSLKTNIYIFLRKRMESDNYVVVSFFRKKIPFIGTNTYWILKEKINNGNSLLLVNKTI